MTSCGDAIKIGSTRAFGVTFGALCGYRELDQLPYCTRLV
jgi:hypothetical protein